MYQTIDMPVSDQRSFLERLVFRGIVFNMSWEDPEMDRRAFNLTSDDTVISITSAGCNPLNFLCQNPRRLISVDSNPAQTALMELKLAAIASVDYDTFYDIFAARNPGRVLEVYRPLLRPLLSLRSQQYWDRKLWIVARGLYNFGRMGLFCRIMRGYLNLLNFNKRMREELFSFENLDEQAEYYNKQLAPRLWRRTSKWFVYFRPFMYLAGVHPNQFRLVDGRHDMFEFVKERVDYVCTKVPLYNNYFLSIATLGRFRDGHVPPYLLRENFESLRNNLDRVTIVNGWLGPFLDSQPAGSITKFNLLDIFDWMTPEQFEGTMRSVLRAAAPGSTLIYRSGSYRLDPPPAIREQLIPHTDLARELFAQDRSATYGSFYIFSVPGEGQTASNGQHQGALGATRPVLSGSPA